MIPSGAPEGLALDEFQTRAMASIDAGRSVLVAAPTGAGKTLVAEHAIAKARSVGLKAFYTTPLKALSNQKYGDLVAIYGRDEVGLLTGDSSINSEAPIVVMTTEVLRNMIYEGSPTLEGLRFVIVDEVHYLQNPYRGGVWEEVIVHCPPGVSLICLSATVSNAEEFGEWLSTVRGATDIVIERKRPVPLENLYLVADRREQRLRMIPTFLNGRPNPEGSAMDSPATSLHPRNGRAGVGWSTRGVRSGRRETPRRVEVVEELGRRGMLPAIYFVFSRDSCDRAARACLEAGLRLTSSDERREIRKIAEARVELISDADLRVLGYGEWLAALETGVASHHAGMVPPFKEAVESCFAAALIKVVFATETLALGVNMPARSVVIERLSKFNGERRERLTPGEYTQLTGRAGRRGLDETGYGIVLWSSGESFESVASLAAARSYELTSSFRPTYNMVANLVQTVTEEEAHRLLNMSFAQFRADAEVVRLEAKLSRLPAGRKDLSFRTLRRRIEAHANALASTFDIVAGVLEEEGYLRGWSLTPRGARLARIYHESDLLVSESLEAGVFEGLEAHQLASLVSVFTYEERARPTARSRGSIPARLSERFDAIDALARRIAGIESSAGLLLTRDPDPGISWMVERWAEGADLASVLGGGALAPGDFVRNIRQVVDLLGQLAAMAPDADTRRVAEKARKKLFRGVMAVSLSGV